MFGNIKSDVIKVCEYHDFKKDMKKLDKSEKHYIAGIVMGIIYSKNKSMEKEIKTP